jgi:hypothetical protein
VVPSSGGSAGTATFPAGAGGSAGYDLGGSAGSSFGGTAGYEFGGSAGSSFGAAGGPTVECEAGEHKFDLCGPNYNPEGDCFCFNGFWACPAVSCATCPDPIERASCDDDGSVVYARLPDSDRCCPYLGACSVPEDLTAYETDEACAKASE